MLAIVTWLGLHNCGLPCASGILANFVTEVGPALDPCTSSHAYVGLAQWSGPRRRRMLATLGTRWCTVDGQMGFMFTELREMHLLDRMLRATDPGEAAKDFMLGFERPKNRDPRRRMMKARVIFRELQAGVAR